MAVSLPLGDVTVKSLASDMSREKETRTSDVRILLCM
jgi:hypothetical protein